MKSQQFLFTMLCALWLTPVCADEPLGGDLKELLEYAREHNAELTATRYEADAAQQRAASAGVLPDPVLRAERYDISNQSGNVIPNVMPTQRYQLSQALPWFGKRDLQRGITAAQLEQANGQTAANWSDLAYRLKTVYALNYYLAANEKLTRQSIDLFDNLEQIVTTRYANGLSTQQDVIRVQVETSALQAELIAIKNERHHAHTELNSLLARPVNAVLSDPVQIRPLPPVAQLDENTLLKKLRAQNPSVRIAEAQQQYADKNRDLSYANRYPGLTLGLARTQYSAMNTWDVMVEFNLPLQQSARRSQEHETEAMLAAASARKQATLNQVESSLSENLSALDSARRTEALIKNRILPQSELTYQSALSGYENGKIDFATLMSAQRQILQVRQQQLKAQLDAQSRLADVEKLLGEEL